MKFSAARIFSWIDAPTRLSLWAIPVNVIGAILGHTGSPVASTLVCYSGTCMCGVSIGWSAIKFRRWKERHKLAMAKLAEYMKEPPLVTRYILDEHGRPQIEPDLIKWAVWYESLENRLVAATERDDFRVSTIFLGLDHNFFSEGPPILWESMIMANDSQDGSELHHAQDRCAGSKEQAEAMHLRMCAKVWPGVEIELS